MKQLGFQIEHCRSNCPKSARQWNALLETLTTNLSNLNINEALETKFNPVLHHHLPKICLAGCPNGCSHPDIKDFSISGYVTPLITEVPCSGCDACVRYCLEKAITLDPMKIIIDNARCLSCGNCTSVCPTGTLARGESGWNLRIGGRVGRHPRFATFAGQVLTDKEVVAWIYETILDYLNNGQPQERLTHYIERKNSVLESRTSCSLVNPLT